MADVDEDEESERFCHELLIKLKKTTEGLLSVHTAQGVWSTYGGLRRVCLDTEAILFHGIKSVKTSSGSHRGFWHFVHGLRFLSPNWAPTIDKLSQYIVSQNLGDTDLGRVWLRDSVQDHSLMTQLDVLVSDEKYLHNFYYDHAFLCQPDYVQAMRVCFKAIELGKQALLSDISPHLMRSGHSKASLHSRSSSLPVDRALRLTTPGQLPSGFSLPSRVSTFADMGNKHTHLNLTYSNQLNSSNLSLTVDPSLGASSLFLQKTLSDPYFVSALDPPTRRDPLSESFRNGQQPLRNQQSTFQQNSFSNITSNNEHQVVLSEASRVSNLSEDVSNLDPSNSCLYNRADNPVQITLQANQNLTDDPTNCDKVVIISPEYSDHGSVSDLYSSLSSGLRTIQKVDSDSANEITSYFNPSIDESLNAADVGAQNCSLIQNVHRPQVSFDPRPSHTQFSSSSDHIELNFQHSMEGIENYTDGMKMLRRGLVEEVPVCRDNVELYISNQPHSLSDENTLISSDVSDSIASSIIACNTSDNSNRSTVKGSTIMIDSLTSSNSVPYPQDEIPPIRIVPHTPTLPHDLSDPFVQVARGGISLPGQVKSSLCVNPARSSDPNLLSRTTSITTLQRTKPPIISVKSDPDLSLSYPMLSPTAKTSDLQFSFTESTSPGNYSHSPSQPWADADLYRESASPGTSPTSKNFVQRSSGSVYIPHALIQGTSLEPSSASASGSAHNGSSGRSQKQTQPPAASRRMGHKRWVSDTSTILVVDHFQQATDSTEPPVSSRNVGAQNTSANQIRQSNGRTHRRASEFEPPQTYHGTLTKPAKGQSLMSYLTSQDFNTCANLEKENAHFRICEALIEAFESMKFNRMMKRQETGKSGSSTDASSDEEIQELRQRIRIRKREKMMAKGRPFPLLSDGQTDTATTSQTASSTPSSQHEFSSSFSGESESDEDGADGRNIDLTMSSDSHGNLAAVRSSGLTLSLASLYSDAELQRSNQQIEKNSSYDESTNPGSAESIAISLLRKFSEKHLPKASELKWLVSENDAPQRLLPLPSSAPVSPDDAEYADLSMLSRTRLRGNLEWAPPRAQIIFSIHHPEKRSTLMSRQNFRCAGCGNRIDPAFMKRYRYCEYLGKYFCQCCHTGEMSIIPGRVIERWDFSRYAIANFSYLLLDKMWSEPLFHVDTINPSLYKRVKGLESIRECRQQLFHLHSLLAVCKRDPVLLKELRKMPSHWISNDDAYSMEDFTQVKSGTMLSRIKSLISLAVTHVSDCQLCQGLGFICGMCQNQRVIFPFQLDSVVKCPVCQACYHKECFIFGKCPKCIRLEARRKLLQEPLSPDSPDSGETTDNLGMLQHSQTGRDFPSTLASNGDGSR